MAPQNIRIGWLEAGQKGGVAVLRGGLKNGVLVTRADTGERTASTVSSTSSSGPAAAAEIDVDEEQAGLDARDIERQHAGRLQIERRPGPHQRVPHRERARPRDPDLVAEVAGVAGARNVDRHARDLAAGHTKIF